ncbi:MAG: DUF3047 domain-containing protein [Candidatus Omnitrophica bacterium]|nr:DUF3047 domain-containing protein [Candidatus Omnitrophota bacterium]
MNRAHKITLAVVAIILCACVAAYSAVVYLKQFTFDDEKALDKWSKMIMKGQVDYTLLKQGEEGYVQALSEKACSALYYRIGFKLSEYPVLTWQWRVFKFPDISNATTELEKDDYAARVYVIFPFLSFSSSKFIEYVWAEDMEPGTILDSPAGKNVKKIVVRSGKVPGDEWVTETRNMYDDYVAAFGGKPTRSAGAVAIMCDADGSGSIAESTFDNIAIEQANKDQGGAEDDK